MSHPLLHKSIHLPCQICLGQVYLNLLITLSLTYSRPTPSIDVSKDVSDEQKAIWKSNSTSFSEQGGSVGNVVSKPMIRFVKETGCPSVSKVNNTKESRKPTVKYAEMYRSQRPRGNQRNWNNQKSQQLGSDFMMIKKACY
ncbi:hypothetical protein Tco_0343042, partial [Tanacetum coccineum]